MTARWLVAALLALLGLHPPARLDAQPPRPDVRVRLQFARAVDLDPANNTRASDYFVYCNIFSHLVRYRPGGTELEPDLAERWQASSGGRVWTFRLRRGVQFHGGYGEATAHDVKFTFERILDPAANSPAAGDFSIINRIAVLDPYTVQFTLREPSLVFDGNQMASRSAMIVSRRAVLERGKAFSRSPIGTGPFVFAQWTPADELVVEANDRYFRGPPRVARITFVPIAEETVAVAALERGEIHAMWTRGSVEAERLLRANTSIAAEVVRRRNAVRFLGLNPQVTAFADVRVRRALAHAINKRELALASAGQLTPADHLLPDLPYLQAAGRAGKFPIYAYDPARAKRLLADAGYPGLRTTLTFPLSSPGPLVAQVIAEQLRRVGVEVHLEGLEQVAWNRRWRQVQFQMTLISFGRGIDPDQHAREILHSSGFPPGRNTARYDAADRLIEAASVEPDPQRRQALYVQLLRQVMTDLPYIPLANEAFIAAWRAPIRRVVSGINNEFYGFTIETGGR